MKHFSVITLFPDLIAAYRDVGIVGRARRKGLIDIEWRNPRDFATDERGTVDDAPYGGGPGMVMMLAPLRAAIRAARARVTTGAHVVYLSPQGRRLDQDGVAELQAHAHLVLVAGRYEGIDERLFEHDIDAEWSVGDYVLSGGELPALTVIDALTRLLPDALGDARSATEDSFCDNLLDHPHYTRPETVDGLRVPAVLLSGDHGAIARWRRQQRLGRTSERRPDLLSAHQAEAEDAELLAAYRRKSRPADAD